MAYTRTRSSQTVVITEPTIEPLTIVEVKEYVGIPDDDNSQDLTILSKIIACRKYVETYLRQSVMTQTLEIATQEFADRIYLPMYPVQSITSVTYTDETGVDQVLSSAVYSLDQYGCEPNIYLNYDQEWPTYRDQINPIRIQYVAGYVDRDSVPQDMKQAMFIILGNWIRYQADNEQGTPMTTIPYAAKQLLDQYRVPNI